jgi:molybdopterin synthase catalytic subunit
VIRLQRERIRTEEVLAAVQSERDGAIATFVGVVRDRNRGRRVRHLEYEAYAEMAELRMRELAEAAKRQFGLSAAAIVHRVGRLAVGETAVVIAVSAPHRDAAFEGCRHLIDTLKRTVPIWKREAFDGGEVWIEGAGETPVRE